MERLSFVYYVAALLSLITIGCCISGNAEFVQCRESDYEALSDLKKGLQDSADRLSTWKGRNCCQWWGITCNNGTGEVISVDLHNMYQFGTDPSGRYSFWNLSGEIRPSLKELRSLRYLDLSYNTFHGGIPGFFSSLINLQYLNLSNAGFTGGFPANFGNLSNLQVLDVSTNDLGLTISSFNWVMGLDSLEHLDMSGADLSMSGSGWVHALNQLPVLTELHLGACGLSGFTYSLSSANFSSLAVLDLIGNNFYSKIPNWVVNISSLVYVDLSSAELYGRIPLGFRELPNLKTLKLDGNYNLTASCFQLFQGSWEKIEMMTLFLNKLHGKLPSSFGNMSSLVHIDLSINNIRGGIPSSIGKLCNLQFIDLSANKLDASLPQSLEGTASCGSSGYLPNLKNLVSSDNKLVGRLPDWLGLVKNLVILNFQYNLLQGPIPDSLGNLQHLSEIRLEANQLNGTLPESLGQLSELTVLDVSINQLTGVITDVHFSRLTKLQILILSANSFILNVSRDWIPPFQVWYLDMGSCHLGPSFPDWIRSQKELNYLDFSNASISGPVPSWVWDMSSNLSLLNVSLNLLEGYLPATLRVAPQAMVDFSFNLFEGPIPLPRGVEILELSSNQFSGSLPSNIDQIMPGLVFLSLSSNKLTGEVPASMGELLSLQVIDLASNNFTGSVPASIGNCSSLRVLDLQDNHMFGSIPESLGQLNLLETLHLSYNNFSGNILPSLLNFTSLETLDLSSNRLTGTIPPWIGNNLPHLRILSLRTNSLSGELPSALSNLSSLQVLDLAENNLNGRIPASFGSFKAMARRQNLTHYLFYGSFMTAYYEEHLAVCISGGCNVYTKTLSLLTSIDMSGNKLNGELPGEITELLGLMVLNLSSNNLTGNLPEEISRLNELLSLDVSGNLFDGSIPESISSMSFLQDLNMSNNNFSGPVPYNGHLTTFDASSFSGNPGLCGEPLNVSCTIDGGKTRSVEENAMTDDKWLYLNIGLGYAAGLLLPLLALAMRRSWSTLYFHLVDRVVEIIL